MEIKKRLKVWIETLSEEQKNNIILELTDFAIDVEEVSFHNTSVSPRYSNTGERLDGLEDEND